MFDHEKLRVYQEALAFASWAEAILDRAKTSILLNIAEGNGRFTPPDRCRFFDTARGSVLECAACLDLLAVKNVIDQRELADGKTMLERIVSMLIGLIRSNSADRLHETPISYRVKSKMN
jgi:four helix bundle protein